MFKFFWGKGSHQSAERLKIQKELFQFQKTVQHGFPSKPMSLAWDPILRLLCIGTRTGAIKVFGAPGVEFYGQLPKDKLLCSLHFVPGHGRVIAVCEDNSLQVWEISSDNSILKCVHSQSLEGKLKKISACCIESNGESLLIGTENGNIYVMDLLKLEMTDTVIYLDVVMQNVTEDFKVNPGAVECISEQPNNPDHILIGYTRGLLVLWNRKTLSADQTFVASQQLESVSWYPNGQKFVSAHNDGSYMKWTVNTKATEMLSKNEPLTTLHYGPAACKAISKILWNPTNGSDDGVFVFSGGMPRSSYGDRFTVSAVKGEEKHITFDFTSKVVDFCVINEVKSNHAEALVVLAEEELIVIDLMTSTWPSFSLPYLASLHSSAITAQSAVAVSSQLYKKIKSFPQGMTSSAKISPRPWPINGGVSISEDADENSSKMLLLTGHEDGSVRFWDASTASVFLLSKFSTSTFFSSDDIDDARGEEQAEEEEEEEWPPFRKVGVFDPYSDDPRLAVKKLSLCPQTGLLTVAGTAGQVVIAEFSEISNEREIPVALVNIVSDRDNFVWKGHDKLFVRKGALAFKEGFQPTSILQLHPPAAATSLALHPEWSVLVVGTAHGLTLYDIILKKEIISKCTLNPNDMTGTGEPMSRRKSFKKSLRESFRRLRKGRSQRPSPPTKTPPTSPMSKVDDHNSIGNAGPAIPAEIRPVERQIEARNLDDGMGSMVRCLLMAKTFVISQSSIATATVWAGTNSGTIFVFSLSVPNAKKRQTEPVNAQLAKEIQLKHRAPVVSINIIDASFAAIDEFSGNSGSTSNEFLPPHRVVISSEEQFKVFTLPNLRPHGKYKLTAYTGCKVRRVAVIPFVSRSDSSYKENCLVCLSNQGEFHILSLPDLRRQMNAQAIKKEDIHATSTCVLTHQGEAFYMLSSSELQRVALSARNCLQIKCHVPGLKKTLVSSEVVDQETKKADRNENTDSKDSVVENQLSALSIASNPVTVREDRENEKNTSAEINNSTIVSVEPETSFGDMTVDSVKDHIVVSFDVSVSSTEPTTQDTEDGNPSTHGSSPNKKEDVSESSQVNVISESTLTEKITRVEESNVKIEGELEPTKDSIGSSTNQVSQPVEAESSVGGPIDSTQILKKAE